MFRFLGALALFACSAVAQNASVYVVHGIPNLPVDVKIAGQCAIPDFNYKNIIGPVSLPAGAYEIAIYPRNTTTPCSGSPALGPVTIPFAEGENATVIAYLKANGDPTAWKFTNDVTPTSPGKARVVVHHTAAAPAVDIKVGRPTPSALDAAIPDLANGDTPASAELRPGDWEVTLYPAGLMTPVFGPVPVTLHPKTVYLVYAVGSLNGGSFTLLPIAVPVK